MNTSAKGFTLFEIAIVLTIIGLLAGGIIVGRDLITAAQVRATAQQISEFNAAYNSFFLKYNCFPGDCPNGPSLGFTPSVVVISDAAKTTAPAPKTLFDYFNPISDAQAFILSEIPVYIPGTAFLPGDDETYVYAEEGGVALTLMGDGNYVYNTSTEGIASLLMLGQAKLIKKSDPVRAVAPVPLSYTMSLNRRQAFFLPIYVQPTAESLATTAGNYFILTSTSRWGNAATNAITPPNAYALDSIIDDGEPGSGLVRATGNNMLMPGGPTHTAAVDDGPNRCRNAGHYVLTYTGEYKATNRCTLLVKGSF